MKKLYLVIAGAALSGCVQSPPSTTPSSNRSPRANELGNAIWQACQWRPVLDDILDIATPPGHGAIKKLATSICKVVEKTPAPASPGGVMTIKFQGKEIRGTYDRS